MTTPTDPTGDGQADASPYLPPSQPAAAGAPPSSVVPPAPTLPTTPTLPTAPIVPAVDEPSAAASVGIDHTPGVVIDQSGAVPFVPAPPPPVVTPSDAPTFDAKAMVDSQRRVNDNPAYGSLPTGTEASREAAKKLRAKAQRKRAKNKVYVRVLAVLLVVGLGAAAWFGYQAYQDQQDRDAAERAAAEDDDRSASEILDDLGSQGEMINAQDALNDAIVPDAGGLGSAIDDARDAVGDINAGGAGGAGGAEGGDAGEPTPFLYDIVVPPTVRTIGERLPDATGREVYVVDAAEFAAADPEAFDLFVSLMGIQPQLIPEAEAFVGLPAVAPSDIIIAVVRDGDRVARATVVGESVALRVDVTP